MVKTKKFAKYGYDTKITTIRIPDLNDLDMERILRKAIDGFVIEYFFTKSNSKTNTNEIDTEILKKMIIPFIENEIEIDLEQKEANRLEQLVSEVMDNG